MRLLLFTFFIVFLSCYEENHYQDYSSEKQIYLSFSDGKLKPAFNKETNHYSLFLQCGYNSINITVWTDISKVFIYIDELSIQPGIPFELAFLNEYKLVEVKVLTLSEVKYFYKIELIKLIEECENSK